MWETFVFHENQIWSFNLYLWCAINRSSTLAAFVGWPEICEKKYHFSKALWPQNFNSKVEELPDALKINLFRAFDILAPVVKMRCLDYGSSCTRPCTFPWEHFCVIAATARQVDGSVKRWWMRRRRGGQASCKWLISRTSQLANWLIQLLLKLPLWIHEGQARLNLRNKAPLI